MLGRFCADKVHGRFLIYSGGLKPAGPRQGALPDDVGRQGQSALAASGAGAGRAPRPGRAPGARSRLRTPQILVFVVLGALLPVLAESAATTRLHNQSAAPQQWKQGSLKGLCPPGSHASEDSRGCKPCTSGVGYTNYSNILPSCISCTVCGQGHGYLVVGIVIGTVIVFLLLGLVAKRLYRRYFHPGCGVDPKCIHKVFFWCSCPPRGPGAQDNAHKEVLSSRHSSSILVSEQKMEGQEPAELARVITLRSPREAKHLLELAEAEWSETSRRLLDPADGADSIESLRLCFHNIFPDNVPFKSWNPLMRLVGLTENEIHVARARAAGPQDALYEMLVTWVNKTGRGASVNTLLDALETMGERLARETIEDHLVGSRRFVYRESGAGSAAT
ncbi:PREDICTED: tumor necrosis factor receptor superfamily member 10A [Galeopterus variegatus]|uniref:Tumor necrosis factor receptor superfamily member 10A n=1 Tax=Galeopterus variegatus TaxID=482537 RepID=A0ABM0QYR4_GALVR|nr:PREDICTED: tumor necrosis factor receptor superfamily member 10A [Galeopterus variegatus]